MSCMSTGILFLSFYYKNELIQNENSFSDEGGRKNIFRDVAS